MAKHRKPSTPVVRRFLLGAATAGLALTGTALGLSTPAQAVEAVCTTDLDCAAWELQQAERYLSPVYVTIHEDLSFDGMSPLYAAKNDLLADAFWAAHAGEDWDTAKWHLAEWLDAYRQV